MALLNDYLRNRSEQGNGVSVPNVNVAQAPTMAPQETAAAVSAANVESLANPTPPPEELVGIGTPAGPGEQPTPPSEEVTPEDVALAEESGQPALGIPGTDDPRYNWVPRSAPGYRPTMDDIIQRSTQAGQERLDYQVQQFERTHDPALYDYSLYGRTALPPLPRLELPPTPSVGNLPTAPDLFGNAGLGFQGNLNPTGNAMQSRNGVANENTNTLGQIVQGIFGIPEAVDTAISYGLNAVGLGGFAEFRDNNLSLRQFSRTGQNLLQGQGLGEAWSNAQEGNVSSGDIQQSSVGEEALRQAGDNEASVYGTGAPGAIMRTLDFPGQAIRGFASDAVEGTTAAYREATRNGGFNLGTFLTYETAYDDLEDAVNARREYSFMVPQGESGLGYTPIREGESGTFLPGGYRIPWLPGWVTGLALDAVTELPGEFALEAAAQARRSAQAARRGGNVATTASPTPDVPPSGGLTLVAPTSPSNVPSPPVSVFVPSSQVSNLPGAARRVSEPISAARTTPLSQVTVLGGEVATQPTRRFVPDVVTVDTTAIEVNEVLPSSQVSNTPITSRLQQNFLEEATRLYQLGAARTDVRSELQQLQTSRTLDIRDLSRRSNVIPQGLDVGTWEGTARDSIQNLLPASRADNVVETPTPQYSPDIGEDTSPLLDMNTYNEVVADVVGKSPDELTSEDFDINLVSSDKGNLTVSLSPTPGAAEVMFDFEGRLTRAEGGSRGYTSTLKEFDRAWREFISRPGARRMVYSSSPSANTYDEFITKTRQYARYGFTPYAVEWNYARVGDEPGVTSLRKATQDEVELYARAVESGDSPDFDVVMYWGNPERIFGVTMDTPTGAVYNRKLRVGSRVPMDGSYTSQVLASGARQPLMFSASDELSDLQAIAAPPPNAIGRAGTPTVYETDWTPSRPLDIDDEYDVAHRVVRQELANAGMETPALRRIDNASQSMPLAEYLRTVDEEVGKAGLNVETVGFSVRQQADKALRDAGYDAVLDINGNIRPLVNVPLTPARQVPDVSLSRAHGAAHDVARQLGDEVSATQERLLTTKYVEEELQMQLSELDTQTQRRIDQLADTQQRLEANVQQESIQRERAVIRQAEVENQLNDFDEFLEDTLTGESNYCV